MLCGVWEMKSKVHRMKSIRDLCREDGTGRKNPASVFAQRRGQYCAHPLWRKDERRMASSAKSFSFPRKQNHTGVHFKNSAASDIEAHVRAGTGK